MGYITKPWVPIENKDPKKEWTLDFAFQIDNDSGLMNHMMFESEKELRPKIIKWRKNLKQDFEENSFGDSTYIICKSMNASIDNLEELVKFREEVLPKLTWEESFKLEKEADLAVLKVIMINEYRVEQARIQREKKVEAGVYPKQMPRPLNQDLTKR